VQFISQPEAQARTYARGQAVGVAGDFTYELGHLAKGENYLHESIEIGRELGEPGKTLVGLWQIGIAYAAWGNDANLARQALEDGLHFMENTPPAVQWIVAWLHHCLGVTFMIQEDYVRAQEHCEKSIHIAQDMGDRYLSAYPLAQLGSMLGRQGKFTEARSYLQEALAIEREMGDHKDTAISLLRLGEISCLEGKYEEARSMLEEALSISRKLSWQMGIGNMLYATAFMEQLMGNVTRAEALYKEALPLCMMYGDHVDVANALEGLAQVAAINGDFKRAADLFGASGLKRWYVMDAEHERWIQLVRQSLGDETFDAHQKAGYNLKREKAVELAFKESEE
jgi:tetratricopeptide (TPR) repeat protein